MNAVRNIIPSVESNELQCRLYCIAHECRCRFDEDVLDVDAVRLPSFAFSAVNSSVSMLWRWYLVHNARSMSLNDVNEQDCIGSNAMSTSPETRSK